MYRTLFVKMFERKILNFLHQNYNMQMRFLSKLSKIKDFYTLFAAKYFGMIALYLFMI